MIYVFKATHRGGAVETVAVPAKSYDEALEKLFFGPGYGVVDSAVLSGSQRRVVKPATSGEDPGFLSDNTYTRKEK